MESSGTQFNPLGHLPCMNCDKVVPHDQAKVFMGVFCCSSCYEIATRSYQRLERELKMMLTLAGEAIRLTMLKKELHLGPAQQPHEIPKSELLRNLIDLADKRQQVNKEKSPVEDP